MVFGGAAGAGSVTSVCGVGGRCVLGDAAAGGWQRLSVELAGVVCWETLPLDVFAGRTDFLASMFFFSIKRPRNSGMAQSRAVFYGFL